MRKTILFTTLVLLTACGKNTDKIGEASTVFNLLGKNDRIEIEAFDDPDVRGVACFLSYAKKGGLKETVNQKKTHPMPACPASKPRPALHTAKAWSANRAKCSNATPASPSKACKSSATTTPNAKPLPTWCTATKS